MQAASSTTAAAERRAQAATPRLAGRAAARPGVGGKRHQQSAIYLSDRLAGLLAAIARAAL